VRFVRLGKIAAQAEALRWRRLIRRTVTRAVYTAIAAIFALGLLAWLHIAVFFALVPPVGEIWAALIVAGVDLLIAAILGSLAAFSGPDRIEREAALVRDEARSQMAEAAIMTVLVEPVLQRAGWGLLTRLMGRWRRR
jgi:hypothetical protein